MVRASPAKDIHDGQCDLLVCLPTCFRCWLLSLGFEFPEGSAVSSDLGYLLRSHIIVGFPLQQVGGRAGGETDGPRLAWHVWTVKHEGFMVLFMLFCTFGLHLVQGLLLPFVSSWMSNTDQRSENFCESSETLLPAQGEQELERAPAESRIWRIILKCIFLHASGLDFWKHLLLTASR